MDIAVFSSAYWDEPLWTNKQHVSARLAARHRVLFIEPGFSRSILTARRGFTPRATPEMGLTIPPGLEVLSPLDLPLRRGPLALRRLGYFLLARRVKRALASWGSHEFVYMVYYPEGVRLTEFAKPRVLAYDCVDDLLTQPHLAKNPQLAASLGWAEQELIGAADVIFATSPALAQRLTPQNTNTHYVPNVADFSLFSARSSEPAALASIPGPRVAYSGALDPYKLDYDLLEALLIRLPNVHLVLIGPGETAGSNTRLPRLAQHPRVHAVGAVPYRSLPAWLQGMDVLLMPYMLTEHTRHIFPLKVHEYLATGRPVVSTALPALSDLAAILPQCNGVEAFANAVTAAIENPDAGRAARLERARAHTWDERVGRIESLLAQSLATKTTALP